MSVTTTQNILEVIYSGVPFKSTIAEFSTDPGIVWDFYGFPDVFFVDSAQTYATSVINQVWTNSTNVSIDTTHGRDNSRCLKLAANNATVLTKSFKTVLEEFANAQQLQINSNYPFVEYGFPVFVCGFYFYMEGTLPGSKKKILAFLDDTVIQVSLDLNTDGTLVLCDNAGVAIKTSTETLSVDTPYYIVVDYTPEKLYYTDEVIHKINQFTVDVYTTESTRFIECINEGVLFETTRLVVGRKLSNTNAFDRYLRYAYKPVDGISFYGADAGARYIADVYMSTINHGVCQVSPFQPSSLPTEIKYNKWSPSTGTILECIGKAVWGDEDTYIYTNTVGNKQAWRFEGLPDTSTHTVYGYYLKHVIEKGDDLADVQGQIFVKNTNVTPNLKRPDWLSETWMKDSDYDIQSTWYTYLTGLNGFFDVSLYVEENSLTVGVEYGLTSDETW